MKRAAFLFSLIFICLAVSRDGFSQSDVKVKTGPDGKKVCPFNIIGLWRSDASTATSPILFDFSPEGGVALMEHLADALPQDFQIITAMNYKLDNPSLPKRIEFTAGRGNDVFRKGKTSLEIADYSDDSFTTIDPTSGQKTRWVREQTHRYFLTFAARTGTAEQGGPALAMWTTLDGRQAKVEALGIQITKDSEGKPVPVFGPIPAELYDQIREESEEKKIDKDKKGDKDQTVMIRLEMTQTEFETTHKVYQAWDKHVKTGALPYDDPYLNGMEFLRRTAEGLNQCGEKVNLQRPTRAERDEITSKHKPPQHMLEYIRLMRKKNNELHINDIIFPWQWRPVIQLPEQ